MRIFILNPPTIEEAAFVREGRCEQRLTSFQYVLLPISLPSIAAVLRENGFEVKILDAIAEISSLGKIKKMIRTYNPILLILNISTVTFDSDIKVAKYLKDNFPKVKIAVLGVHATSMPDESLSYLYIDYVIRGEPEITIRELAKTLQNKKQLNRVTGLSYKYNHKIHHNPDRPFIKNLDSLPFPARDLVKNELYLMSMSTNPHTIILTSRGCPNYCIFCTAHCYYGRRFRTRSAESVASEMEEIEKKYHINYVTMWADTFTLDHQFVFDLCQEIEKRKIKIKWMCNSRVNTINLKLLKAMKKAGCTGIAYGVESGNQEILNNVQKGTTLAQIEHAFKITHQAGIDSLAHVIFGLPGENKITIKKTIRFIKKIDPDFVQFYCAVPFPGTKLRELALEKGWLKKTSWKHYEINQAILETRELSAKDLAKTRRNAYLSFYLRPAYIIKISRKFIKRGEFWYMARHALSFFSDWVSLKND